MLFSETLSARNRFQPAIWPMRFITIFKKDPPGMPSQLGTPCHPGQIGMAILNNQTNSTPICSVR
ncbi:hypothetical protein HNQ59_001903 [Chitinivorax tropicus]|uniref:Uncharacterized protein n=1 Tax=Chitinivorax tropicus TaxID=714531 RepID=A0A840MPD9_9PROT|nr:hypothetical protein [Chitinivorax tropicus]